MTKEQWTLHITSIIQPLEKLQADIEITNEDSALHNLFDHWIHVLTLLYKEHTGEDYDLSNQTLTH